MSAAPTASIAALIFAIGVTVAVGRYMYLGWAPDQQYFLREYILRTVGATIRPSLARGRDFLAAGVYEGRTLWQLAAFPAEVGAGALLLLLIIAIPKDLVRSRERRLGRRLKGPELVDARTFRKRLKSDGVSFRQSRGPAVVIPRAIENSHILMAGDTRTGKSTLNAVICDTAAARGERVVIYDPSPRQDYLRRFFNAKRGDIHLNPRAVDGPYWKPGDEVLSEDEALTLAASLIPRKDHEINSFFPDSARTVFAALLQYRPTAQQLVEWMTDRDRLADVVKGTVDADILATILDP